MIFRRANRRSWYVRLRTGGRDRWLSLRTDNRREAEARAARLRYANLPEVIRAVATPPPMPLLDLWDNFARTADLRPSTWESYHRIFSLFCRWARVANADQVSPAVAEQYLQSLRGKAARTANLARGVLSHLWRAVGLADPWAHCHTRPRKTVPYRPLTDTEVRQVLAEAAKVAPWWRPLILTGFYTGLRLGDAAALRWSQFGPALAHIELRPAKTAKSGRAVFVPVVPALRAELTAWRASGAALWPEAAEKDQRRSLSPEFSRILARAKVAGEAGVSRVGFHSLRVTFTTRARRAGIPLDDLRAFLGHTTTTMTQHYVDSPEAVKLDRYPDLAPAEDGSQPVAIAPGTEATEPSLIASL